MEIKILLQKIFYPNSPANSPTRTTIQKIIAAAGPLNDSSLHDVRHDTDVEEVLIIQKKIVKFFGPRMFISS